MGRRRAEGSLQPIILAETKTANPWVIPSSTNGIFRCIFVLTFCPQTLLSV